MANMASFKGVQIKGVTRFKGHEGELLTQGSIYINGKKAGEYSEDAWSGPIQIDIKKEFKDLFDQKVKEHYENTSDNDSFFMSEDIFMYEVITLYLREQDFKGYIKQGYKYMVYVAGKPLNDICFAINVDDEQKIRNAMKSDEDLKAYSDKELTIYRKQQDFIIE